VSDQQLQVIAPDPRVHRDTLIDLVAKCFADETWGYYELREACRRVYVRHSHYDWEASRIGLLGDRLVAHFGVWKYQMRIGAARVQVGGVGAVATDGDFRKRGYMDLTTRASLDAMWSLGYDMTILFGVDHLYHRYGYVRAWTNTNYFVPTGDLPKEPPDGRVQRFAVRPRPDLAALYNVCYAEATGTAVRPTFLRADPSWQGNTEGYLWKRDGAPAGYVFLTRRGNQLRCIEYVGDATQALRVVAALARKWNCAEVQFETIPPNSELVTLLCRGTCRSESHYRRNGGSLVRLVNLASTLQKMEGELSHRLQASPLAGWRGEFALSGSREQATLTIGDGRVIASARECRSPKHAIRGGDELVQLLLGTDDPAEVIAAGGMEATGDAARLAEVLFPARQPQLSRLDRF